MVWLSGVRRVGKTTLAKMLADGVYVNCDLPSETRRLEDPEPFLDTIDPATAVILDEVHRLEDPSRILKIAADAYSQLKVLATGSSTLAATRKFRDSLTGRKRAVYLSPVLWTECQRDFQITDLDQRLLHGGLPEMLLSTRCDPEFFSEWIDSYYARDVQELFGIRNRIGFLRLLQLLMRQSGGQVDYTNLGKLAELSRPTVVAHVEALTLSHAVFLLPPFHGGGRREITKRPKAYAFDTGFVAYARGWNSIRSEDRGNLWEHLVLDLLRSVLRQDALYYWQDKSRREIDFVIRREANTVDAIECKIEPERFNRRNLEVFRSLYPGGENYVLSPFVKKSYQRRYGQLSVRFASVHDLPDLLHNKSSQSAHVQD